MCTFVGGQFAFAGLNRLGFKCLTCRYDTHNCANVAFVLNKVEEDDESYPFLSRVFSDHPVRRSPSTPSCLSKLRIKFNEEAQSYHRMKEIKSLLPMNENSVLEIMPNGGNDTTESCCPSCLSLWSRENPRKEGWVIPDLKLYNFDETVICKGKQAEKDQS